MIAPLGTSIHKEARALLLPWLACAAALGASRLLGAGSPFPAIVVFSLGAIVIGAWSIGHEYSGRTLSLWLTQPVRRSLLFGAKFGVAGGMLLVLALGGFVLFGASAGAGVRGIAGHELTALALPFLIGLGLAPPLTMACRSPLAGTVFTLAILTGAWGSAHALSAFGYGPPSGPTVVFAEFRFTIMARVVTTLAPIAAVASWLMFTRLEAIDGAARPVSLDEWFSARTVDAIRTRTPRPLWQLARKELYLQQITFVVAALYVVLWGVNVLVMQQNPEGGLLLMGPVTLLYCVMVGLLAGALASAEERQLGTLEWQLLQPIASWQQWTLKAGTALALTAALGLALPMALALLYRTSNDLGFPPTFMAVVMGACLLGLYVSSFTTGGVRSLLASVVFVSAMVLAIRAVMRILPIAVFADVDGARRSGSWHTLASLGDRLSALQWVRPGALTVMIVVLVVALWQLALRNHRSADSGTRLVPRQAMWLAVGLLVGVSAFTILDGAINTIAHERVRQQYLRQQTKP